MRVYFEIGPDAGFDRTQAQEFLSARGVSTRMVWTGNTLPSGLRGHRAHRAPAGGLRSCDRIMDRSLSLHTHHDLGPEHTDYSCGHLEAFFEHYS